MPKTPAIARDCDWRPDVCLFEHGCVPNIHWNASHRRGDLCMSRDEEQEPGTESAAQSVEMLKAVIDGDTYDAVAERFGVTRTAVERRVKAIAIDLIQAISVEGLNEGATAFARRLRRHRDAILIALANFELPKPFGPRKVRIVSADELAEAMLRIKGRSQRPRHDQALFYMLFATGARPLEIARFEVRDYLNADGTVRRESGVRAEVAITGKARPLYFASTRLDALLGAYLRERVEQELGLGEPGTYGGLNPRSRLFLSANGAGFQITPYGEAGQRRYLCRAILEAYRKLFRYSQLKDVTSLSVRHTVASRLYDRGADEDQVGLLLGIGQRSAVRDLMRRRKPTIAELVDELV